MEISLDSFCRKWACVLVFAGRGIWVGVVRVSILGLLAFGFQASIAAQLTVTSNNNVNVTQNSVLLIDKTPLMPQLNLVVPAGVTYCDTLSWSLTIDWFAPSGQQSLASLNGQFPCGHTAAVDWHSVGYAGGTATLQWIASDSCGTDGAGSITFTIKGTNPDPPSVRSFIPSVPWFWFNLLAWESRAWSSSPTGIYHQYDSNGFPINCNCPNGIGLTQLDPGSGGTFPSGTSDFWAWNYNEVDGFNLLVSKRTGAYNYWTSEWNDMLTNTGGNAVPANWSSDCTTHANGAVCGGFTAGTTLSCSFSSASANGSPSGFGDGNWIHNYNSNFFVDWVDGTPNSPGHWEYDVQGSTSGYVFNVCKSPAI